MASGGVAAGGRWVGGVAAGGMASGTHLRKLARVAISSSFPISSPSALISSCSSDFATSTWRPSCANVVVSSLQTRGSHISKQNQQNVSILLPHCHSMVAGVGACKQHDIPVRSTTALARHQLSSYNDVVWENDNAIFILLSNKIK